MVVAQSVERNVANVEVVGSSPIYHSNYFGESMKIEFEVGLPPSLLFTDEAKSQIVAGIERGVPEQRQIVTFGADRTTEIDTVPLLKTAALIDSVGVRDGHIMCEATILDTPSGIALKDLMQKRYTISVSAIMRGAISEDRVVSDVEFGYLDIDIPTE